MRLDLRNFSASPDLTFFQQAFNLRLENTVWLVLDVGNSEVKGGLYDDGLLHHTFRATHETASLVATLRGEIRGHHIERAGFSSVVPRSTDTIERALSEAGVGTTRIVHGMRLPFELAYETPETLGADRLAAAAAAWLLFGRAMERGVIAIDAGTALTYDVVDRAGIYRGGAIAPGPALMQRSLHHETAQLPEVKLSLPADPIGRSTVESIRVGVMYGFIDGVRGLLHRINDSLGCETFIVVTGGWGSMLQDHVPEVDVVEPHLVLEGIRMLMEANG